MPILRDDPIISLLQKYIELYRQDALSDSQRENLISLSIRDAYTQLDVPRLLTEEAAMLGAALLAFYSAESK